MTRPLPPLTLLSLALLSVTALASGPTAAKAKKHRQPQRSTYSSVNPFATTDPFTSGLKASTSTTANKPTQTNPLSPSNSNPYLNLNPKTTSKAHPSHNLSKD